MRKTEDEILRAMEECRDMECKGDNSSCPYQGEDQCVDKAHDDAIALIRELQDRNRAQRAELLANGKELSFPDIVKKFQEYEAEQAAKEAQGKPRSLMGNVRRVRALLSKEERLAQLAKECAELRQAALKYRRALTADNPTLVSQMEAFVNLREEAGDVIGCLLVLNLVAVDTRPKDIVDPAKFARWVERLEARDDV